jgi:hypothetical protein
MGGNRVYLVAYAVYVGLGCGAVRPRGPIESGTPW